MAKTHQMLLLYQYLATSTYPRIEFLMIEAKYIC